MNKWAELLAGLVLIILAVVVWMTNVWALGDAALVFLKGAIVWCVIGLGVLFLLLSIADMRG